VTAVDPHLATPSGKPRARALGIPFDGKPGAWNAITDVPGVEVGYVTLVDGDDVRTGVTAIHPLGKERTGQSVQAGCFSLNGNGEMTGMVWIDEAGTLAMPITITNTHAVGVAHAGTVRWLAGRHRRVLDTWALPVAAETWDGFLNDINGGHVREEHVVEALDRAERGPLEEGAVGGGTGMICYGFKGGSATASRLVRYAGATYTVGVFLQANFGARAELRIAGVPVGRALPDDDQWADLSWLVPPGAGSVIAIVATDAPLAPGQCKALARRVPLGLARTGTSGSHFSGDIFLAFSTGNPGAISWGLPLARPRGDGLETLRSLPWGRMDPLFEATVEAVEEAVVNVLVANETMVGRAGHRVVALPREPVLELLAGRGAV
jgi:L-aminopeptidase/D-esterase-like protein